MKSTAILHHPTLSDPILHCILLPSYPILPNRPQPTISYHAILPHRTPSYLILPHPTPDSSVYPVLPYPTPSYHILSCHPSPSYPILPQWHLTSPFTPILPRPTSSYPILPYPTQSHPSYTGCFSQPSYLIGILRHDTPPTLSPCPNHNPRERELRMVPPGLIRIQPLWHSHAALGGATPDAYL